jgi:uncharacterized protein YjbI with pentapeptide repeats
VLLQQVTACQTLFALCDLTYSDFSAADLRQADFRSATFSRTRLHRARQRMPLFDRQAF